MSNRVVVPFPKIEVGTRDFVWFIVISGPFIATHLLTPVKLPWLLLLLLCVYPALVLMIFLTQRAAKKWPDQFCSYIEVGDMQLVVGRPFRRKIAMQYLDIQRIVALSAINGYGESETRLSVYTNSQKLTIGGALLYGSKLPEKIWALPGYDQLAWSQSDAEEDSIRWSFISKRTEIMRKPKVQ